jgi:hypothetical protein
MNQSSFSEAKTRSRPPRDATRAKEDGMGWEGRSSESGSGQLLVVHLLGGQVSNSSNYHLDQDRDLLENSVMSAFPTDQVIDIDENITVDQAALKPDEYQRINEVCLAYIQILGHSHP